MPDSLHMVISLMQPSSAKMLPTPELMPTPRFSTPPGCTSMAQRRAMTFRSSRGMGGSVAIGRRIWPEKEGS